MSAPSSMSPSTLETFKQVWEIFEVALQRSRRDDVKLKAREIMDKVQRIVRQLDEANVDPEVVYYALIGLADTHLIPLTPGDIEDLRDVVVGARIYRR